MNFAEFKKGVDILQGAFEKEYKPETLHFIFERVGMHTAEEWLSVCEMLVQQADRLPATWKIIQTFPPMAEIKTSHTEMSESYWDVLNARHEEFERIVGEPFENFVKICNGGKKLASLYFAKAYWNAKGVTSYDETYDSMIGNLERGGKGDFVFANKSRTVAEVKKILSELIADKGFVANRWYWKRFWPQELAQAEGK